jgi:hypothetical protein
MVCYYLPEFEAATPAKLKNFITSPEVPNSAFKSHIQTVLSIFQALVANHEFRTVITSASPIIAPVEFIYIGALISKLNIPASSELAGSIYNFRSAIRREYKDIRMNDKVSKSMYAYIDKHNPVTIESTQSDTTSSPRKRRRSTRDDDEYRPGRDDQF